LYDISAKSETSPSDHFFKKIAFSHASRFMFFAHNSHLTTRTWRLRKKKSASGDLGVKMEFPSPSDPFFYKKNDRF